MENLKIAFCYGFPSKVCGCKTVEESIELLDSYDIIIFGPTLEYCNHPDHSNTKTIIATLDKSNKKFYGYINSVTIIDVIKKRIDSWQEMGVSGIFCDKFGYNYGTTREKQNIILKYIHQKNLNAVVNAKNPDDVFGSLKNCLYNPQGKENIIGSNDLYLKEIKDLSEITNSDWLDKILVYKQHFSTRIAYKLKKDTNEFTENKISKIYYDS